MDWAWTRVLPTHASLILIGGAFGEPAPPAAAAVAASVAWLLACDVAANVWARRWVARFGAGRVPGRRNMGGDAGLAERMT